MSAQRRSLCTHRRAVIIEQLLLIFVFCLLSSSEAICRLSLSRYGSLASISALGRDLIKWLLQIQIDRNTHITLGYGCRASPRGLDVCFPLQKPCQSLPLIPVMALLLLSFLAQEGCQASWSAIPFISLKIIFEISVTFFFFSFIPLVLQQL